MIDIEKVIKGLECCIKSGCGGCPYFKDNPSCQDDKDKEALELLKEQKERIGFLERSLAQFPKSVKLLDAFGNYEKVVRCENCRWWHESELEQFKGFGECGQANGIALKPHDWFCADGERKEGR